MKSIIISNTRTKHLFDKIQDSSLIKLKVDPEIKVFADGEKSVKFTESIRGKYVYLLAETSHDLTELLLTLDALKRCSAVGVTVILPYYGYARSDRGESGRSSIGAKVMADCIAMNGIVDKIVTFDLHTDQISMAFNISLSNVNGKKIFLNHISQIVNNNTVICSPDEGGIKRAGIYANSLNVPMVSINKERKEANVIKKMELLGDVTGKEVILIDDMTDTGGTLKKAAQLLKEKGALKVFSVATHGILSGAAVENINSSVLDCVYLSDTVISKEGLDSNKVKVISCVPVLEDVIKRLINNESISELNK